MKKGIHPTVYKTKVVCTSCGNEFETHSTKKEIRVDTCSNCHPFYTGKQRFAQAAGQIERFNRKYGLGEKAEEEVAKPAKKAEVKAEVKAEAKAEVKPVKKAEAKAEVKPVKKTETKAVKKAPAKKAVAKTAE